MIRIEFFLIAVLFLCSCSDTVVSRYETRSEAEADSLFQRGWLPSIIPQSSSDIQTQNDLDINVSEGEFSFLSDHAQEFITHLRRMDASEVSMAHSVRLMKRGYWPYHYINGYSEWMFLINVEKGHCEYKMRKAR